MSTYRWANLGLLAVLLLLGLMVSRPGEVLAESATVNFESPLLENPWPDAPVLIVVPAGAMVELAGPPSDGYYPVTIDASYGYLPAESLVIHKEAPEAGTMPVDGSDPAITDGVADPAAIDTGQSNDPSVGVGGMDAASADPPVEVETAPVVEPVAEAPIPDPNPENIVVAPEIGPMGPASVTADTGILLGPGPEFGLLASAPVGSVVEQTGKVVNGWVTVKFAEITGWAPLDRLGPPGYGDPAVATDAAAPDAAVAADPGGATDPAAVADAGAVTDPTAIDPAVPDLAVTDPTITDAAAPVSAEATPVSG
jgi:hypothetical protein